MARGYTIVDVAPSAWRRLAADDDRLDAGVSAVAQSMLAELDFPPSGIQNVSHPNSRARAAVGAGERWPVVERGAIERYIDWWINTGFLPPPDAPPLSSAA